MIPFLLFLLILIPITAGIDYFVFRGRYREEMGKEMKWHYFITPCLLEISMFIAGYLMGINRLLN